MMHNSAYLAGVALVATLFCATFLTGCGAATTTPALGILYTDVKGPVTATGNASSDRMLEGKGTVTSYLGLVATGDASIESAANNAGITKIHHVDYHSTSVLGLIATYTVIVYGNGPSTPIERKSQVIDNLPKDLADALSTPTETKSRVQPIAPTVEVKGNELLLKTLSPNLSYPTFDVDLEFQTDLDNQKFTEGLRAAFLNHGRILAPSAYIFVRKKEDGDWLIFNARDEQAFLVKKGGGKLTVITLIYESSSR